MRVLGGGGGGSGNESSSVKVRIRVRVSNQHIVVADFKAIGEE